MQIFHPGIHRFYQHRMTPFKAEYNISNLTNIVKQRGHWSTTPTRNRPNSGKKSGCPGLLRHLHCLERQGRWGECSSRHGIGKKSGCPGLSECLRKRDEVYRAARARNPRRWTGETRDWTLPTSVYLNPERDEGEALNKAA